MNADKPLPTRPELFDLYKLALSDYHFQINLGWDRAKYFLGLNSLILGMAGGLLKLLEGDRAARAATSLLFIAGVVVALLGWSVLRTTHRYYRMAAHKALLIAEKLGLIAPYPGMVISDGGAPPTGRSEPTKYGTLDIGSIHDLEKKRNILADHKTWFHMPIGPSTVGSALRAVQLVFVVLHLGGLVILWVIAR